MSWARAQQEGQGKIDSSTVGGRGGTDNTRTGNRRNRLGGERQSSRGGPDNFHDREARGADRLAEGRGCGQAARRPEGGGEGGTDNTTGGEPPDDRTGGMEDRRPNRTRGLRTKLGVGRVFVRCLRLVVNCNLGKLHLMASSAEEVQLASWCNG